MGMNVVDSVKPFIVFFVVISLFTAAPFTHAQTYTASQKAAIRDRIEILVTQVEKLQKQLALLEAKGQKAKASEFSYKTKFYTGTYEALYLVDGKKLIPSTHAGVRAGDQLLWNTLIDIAGASFAKADISEFRIYSDTRSQISAFVEEKPDHTWILGFNREGNKISEIYDDESVVELLLHEYGHIFFFSNPSIETDFKQEFWTGTQRSSDFITQYAANNATEDMAESFVYFVTADKPEQRGVSFDKVRFLYGYPELIKLREQLRASSYF